MVNLFVGGGDHNLVRGYVLKADIKRYFDTISNNILIKIINKHIKDEKVIWLVKQILSNFDFEKPGIGMPLGNYTSQFFANIYLNELDYFIKHNLRAKYYIRYVDDFIILHQNRKVLEDYKEKINNYLKDNLQLELHPDKSKISELKKGVTFLGYKIFYCYKSIKKKNKIRFERKFENKIESYKEGILDYENLTLSLSGWFGYIMWANTYKYRKKLAKKLEEIEK